MRQTREYCQVKNMPYYETSAKKAVNVADAFQCIARCGMERAQNDLGRLQVDQMANIRLDGGAGGRGDRRGKRKC